MAKQSSVNLDITSNADGYDIAGGTTPRKLTISGGDIAMVGGGSAVLTFPSTTGTIPNVANSSNLTGAIINGGNSTGAALTIGSNDAFGLNLETNNVTFLAAATDGTLVHSISSANTSTVVNSLIVQNNSTGTPSAGFGGSIRFRLESSTTNDRDSGSIQSV